MLEELLDCVVTELVLLDVDVDVLDGSGEVVLAVVDEDVAHGTGIIVVVPRRTRNR